jgi:hypothetical protein
MHGRAGGPPRDRRTADPLPLRGTGRNKFRRRGRPAAERSAYRQGVKKQATAVHGGILGRQLEWPRGCAPEIPGRGALADPAPADRLPGDGRPAARALPRRGLGRPRAHALLLDRRAPCCTFAPSRKLPESRRFSLIGRALREPSQESPERCMQAQLPHSCQSGHGSRARGAECVQPHTAGVHERPLGTPSRAGTSKPNGFGYDGTHLAVFRVRPRGELVNGETAV